MISRGTGYTVSSAQMAEYFVGFFFGVKGTGMLLYDKITIEQQTGRQERTSG